MIQEYYIHYIKSSEQVFSSEERKTKFKAPYLFNLAVIMGFIFFLLISKHLFILEQTIEKFPTLQEDSEEFKEDDPKITFITTFVKKGQTLAAILKESNVNTEECTKVLRAVNKINPDLALKLNQNQKITLDFDLVFDDDVEQDESLSLWKLVIYIDKVNRVEVINNGDVFIAKYLSSDIKKVVNKKNAIVKGSLMKTLKSLGINNKTVVELLNCYSHAIDINHQLNKGDEITVIIEKYLTKEGDFVNYGKVLFSSLKANGRTYDVYNYHNNNQSTFKYFFEDGKSSNHSLLKTPVKVTKISSYFGKRASTGYSKMHKGIDFSAPIGTEIKASGDGVVVEAGWHSSYGNCIQIRHNIAVVTLYAHAKHFAPNIMVGSKVHQGQTIAYVGMTGRTTGPHLHYEVKINGKNVNPLSMKTTPSVQLSGMQLKEFIKFKNQINLLTKKLEQKQNIEISL